MLLYSTRNITNSFLRQSRPARQMLRPGRHPGAFRAAFGGATIHRKRVMAQLQQVLLLRLLIFGLERSPRLLPNLAPRLLPSPLFLICIEHPL